MKKQKKSIKFLFATVFFILFIPIVIISIIDDFTKEKFFQHDSETVFNVVEMIFATVFFLFFAKSTHLAFFRLFKYKTYKKIDSEIIFAIAIYTAYLYSSILFLLNSTNHLKNWPHIYFFETIVFLIYFLQIGEQLKSKSFKNISEILNNFFFSDQKEAFVNVNNVLVKKQIDQIPENSFIVVAKNAIIPIDGIVFDFDAIIDENKFTGNKKAIVKPVGSLVRAGSINDGETFTLKTISKFENSQAHSIIKNVENQIVYKQNLNILGEKIAVYLIPFILLAVLLNFVIWILITPAYPWLNYSFWVSNTGNSKYLIAIINAIAILSITGPVGFANAAPYALKNALLMAVKNQMIIKNLKIVDELPKIKNIVLNLNATMNYGKYFVSEYVGQEDAYKIIYSLHRKINTNISSAVLKFKNIESYYSVEIIEETENEITFVMEEEVYKFGILNDEWKLKNEFLNDKNFADKKLYLVKNNHVMGCIHLINEIEKSSIQTIEKLSKNKFNIYLFSSLNEFETKTLAEKLNIYHYQSQMDEKDKLHKIKELQKEGDVLFIGNGIEDKKLAITADVSVCLNNQINYNIDYYDVLIHRKSIVHLNKLFNVCKNLKNNLKYNFYIESVFGFGFLVFAIFGLILFSWLIGIIAAISNIVPFLVTIYFYFSYKKIYK